MNVLTFSSIILVMMVGLAQAAPVKVMSPLHVEVNASEGSVTAGFSPSSMREEGKSYTITARPRPPSATSSGYLFDAWTVNSISRLEYLPSSSDLQKPTLTFIHNADLRLTASFVPSPFPALAGVYTGSIYQFVPDPGRPWLFGSFTLTLQKSGAFSARMTVEGVTRNIIGAFDRYGNAQFGTLRSSQQTFQRSDGLSLTISLQLYLPQPHEEQIGGLGGTLSASQGSTGLGWAMIVAERAYFNGTTRRVPEAYLGPRGATAAYTAMFMPSFSHWPGPYYPGGNGFASFTLTRAGVVKIAGVLGDGTAWSASSALSGRNGLPERLPLHVPLYAHRGFLSGTILVDTGEVNTGRFFSDFSGTLYWQRPHAGNPGLYSDGWLFPAYFMAAKYEATRGESVLRGAPFRFTSLPAAPWDVSLIFKGGLLPTILTKGVNLSAADAVTEMPANDPSFSLSINRSTGAFWGTLQYVDNPFYPVEKWSAPYRGVIYQRGPHSGGYGYLIDPAGGVTGVSLMRHP